MVVVTIKSGAPLRGRVMDVPPPTMHTSTWSLSRSMVAGSKESSGVAIHGRAVEENSLVCGDLFGIAVAVHDGRNMLLLGTLVENVVEIEDCVVANGLAVRARRRDMLAGVDMASGFRRVVGWVLMQETQCRDRDMGDSRAGQPESRASTVRIRRLLCTALQSRFAGSRCSRNDAFEWELA